MVSAPIVRGHRYLPCTRPARGGVTAVACWLFTPLALLGAPPTGPAAAPPAAVAEAAAGASPTLSLPQAIDLALAANRALAAARLARPIAAANVAVAGQPPHPHLLLAQLRAATPQ